MPRSEASTKSSQALAFSGSLARPEMALTEFNDTPSMEPCRASNSKSFTALGWNRLLCFGNRFSPLSRSSSLSARRFENCAPNSLAPQTVRGFWIRPFLSCLLLSGRIELLQESTPSSTVAQRDVFDVHTSPEKPLKECSALFCKFAFSVASCFRLHHSDC